MFFRRLNWNVVSWFKTVSAISYAVIFAGLVMMGYNWVTKGYPIKLGLSFTGGTDVTVKYQSPATQAQVRQALATIGVTDAQINTIGKSSDPVPNERFTISTQSDFGDRAGKLWAALGTVAPVDRAQSQISSVGPSLSREYLVKALWALVIAIGIQFVYIAFRFGWNIIFGEVVVIALVRDALMMIGIYALAQKRADDAFLAAVLTVIGYSVMDTIVILDRIRENVKVMAGENYEKIVNTSILQTMTRSVNTLATVVITLVALLAFGGASLQNFAFALLVGICSGGYHSIFYSAPLVYILREREQKKAARLRAQQRAIASEKPRTVAEARAQAASALTREQIVAARKERRTREKQAPVRTSGGPARYRRKRSASPPSGTGLASAESEEFEDEEGEPLDPLDAQNAGVHEHDLALGHEEIHLNLEDDGEHVPEHGPAEGESPAPAKRE
ncbi:MAG TPA: protein translocase subunit SecF [Candidatus Baltobacteraceae bacterium]|nr:protein translocase subunit SecF [Candidatus Baltobacteraceae bacterium]